VLEFFSARMASTCRKVGVVPKVGGEGIRDS
jgi:hypothetical protein